MTLWLTILAMGAVTFALRLSLIGLIGRTEIPALLRRTLRFVPPAVLSAIIFPAVLQPNGALELSTHNLRLFAALAAALVAWRTKNVLLTIAAGMAALWVLQALVR